jgi:two-component system cell cycle sensor histidine kinase/response regulator CckA
VEDEDAVRAFAVRALENRGYTVLSADCGEEGLDVAEAHDGPIDVIVSDVVMPGMDGPTRVEALRPLRPEARIVFVSGYAESNVRERLDGDQKVHFLPKPFTLVDLSAKVKEVLGE